ncbi:hypothetical protein AX15_000067 [Amanita polypyramis BW_CC]|nr:hypothetical protein AX15_000067 [Amanita polypyramis BW_CC]
MLPAQRNKIDISKLSLQEQQLLSKYGKLPTHKNVLMKMQKQERKYFDSGDYALSKAGRAPPTIVGTAIPNPENIPHASSGTVHNGHQGLSVSPTSSSAVSKESSLAYEEIKASDPVEIDSKDADSVKSDPKNSDLAKSDSKEVEPVEFEKAEQI